MTRKLSLLAFGGLALAAPAISTAQNLATFTLNDGLFRYNERSIWSSSSATRASIRTGTGGGSADFGFASGTSTTVSSDYVFQNWWWYRGANDAREFGLSNQVMATQLSANSVALRYEEAVGGGTAPSLRFDFTYTLNQISTTQAALTINWNITNIGSSTETVAFYNYTDFDVITAGDDFYSRTLGGGGVDLLRADLTSTNNTQFGSLGADLRLPDAWQVGPFSATGSPRTALSNATVDNLNSMINGTNPGDLAAAFQWNLSLRAGESAGGRLTKGYNYAIPTPGALALLGLGGLVAARRRRA